MEKRKVVLVAAGVVCAAVLLFVATSIIAKPKSYEDCILKNMKDAQTREASIAIAGACRKSFPNPFDQFDGQPPAGR